MSAPPPTGPPGLPDLFATERGRLLDLLGTLAPGDWQLPSPCPGWTVLGLCHHLVGDDVATLSWHRDGYRGTPAPDGLTEPEFIAWLDDLQVEWVRAARRLSPRLTTELLAWTGPRIAEAFRYEDPTARTAHVSWAGPDPVPVWLEQVRELSEYWIHRQQILQALERPPDLRADVLAPVLDGLRWAYPYRLGAAELPSVAPGDTVTIAITGPVSATWHLVAEAPAGADGLAGGGGAAGGDGGGVAWAFRPEPGPRQAAALSMTTDEAWRLLSNNLPAARQAALRLSGDEALTTVLRRTRAIVGAPQ